MKKYTILVICLVLTASMFVGCGCTNSSKDSTSAPTVLPTNEEVWDTTEAPSTATTASTSEPGTMTTESSVPSETADRGNGPLEDSTDSTEGTMDSRAQRAIPNVK